MHLGKNVTVGDYVIIGLPPNDTKDGELQTVIGDHSIIRSHSIIYAGTKIGNHFHTGHHVTIREHTKIGDNVSIGTSSCIEHHVNIENNVRIHSNAFIPEYSKLLNHCWIGPNVVLTNAKYPNAPDTKTSLNGVTIGNDAKIGANVTILPGINIGAHSLVGAGSVVVKDVSINHVVVGNPAKSIKMIDLLASYNMEEE